VAAFSQKTETPKKDNLLFLLRQPEHIDQALKTIGQLPEMSDSGINPGKVVIIVCGEAVNALTNNEASRWTKQLVHHPELSILACGLSLTKFNKTEKDLVQGIGYTPNGFVKAFQLQKQGYLSVEL